MASIIEFPNSNTSHTLYEQTDDEPVALDKVLAGLEGREFDDIIFIGRQSNGSFYFATTSGDLAQINWDLEKAKQILISVLSNSLGDDYED